MAEKTIQNEMKNRAGKYLSFSLGEEDFGIGIIKIKEIIGMMPVTAVPYAPEFVRGVINLRGRVIPVIDLRCKFDMPTVEYTDRTCIIIVEVDGGGKMLEMGIVVDSVSEVLNIKGENIEDPPALGAVTKTNYILGMAKLEDSVKILLEIDRLLAGNEIVQIEKAAA